MPFEKGHKLAKGRPKGSENELTKQMKTVKETVLNVFNELQDDPKTELKQFAKRFPREFHAIAAKLIPTEVNAQITSDGIANLIISPASTRKDEQQSDTNQ
jgi:hypothetical protein